MVHGRNGIYGTKIIKYVMNEHNQKKKNPPTVVGNPGPKAQTPHFLY